MTYAYSETYRDVEYFRISNTVQGAPRYVVHYLDIPYREQAPGEDFRTHQLAHIEHAKARLFGTKYRAKWFGGGIVFTSHDIRGTIDNALV